MESIRILDGGLASELERDGYTLNTALWSARLLIDHPGAIKRVHMRYLEAGADIITSASYQAFIAGFLKEGIAEGKARELIKSSVRIAKEARDDFWENYQQKASRSESLIRVRKRPLVAASMGSFGASLCNGAEFTGDFGGVTVADLVEFHKERLLLLAEEEPDLFLFETIPSLQEGSAIVALIKLKITDLPCIVSFSCKDSQHTCHGEDFAECVELFDDLPQVIGVGVNCTSPLHVEDLLAAAQERMEKKGSKSSKLLVCYPNSGELWVKDKHCWAEGTSNIDQFKILASKLKKRGLVNIMGGCCRTSPETIKDIVTAIFNE